LEPANGGMLGEILAAAESIKAADSRAATLSHVAEAQATAGLLREAGATIDKVARIAWSIEKGRGSNPTVWPVVDKLAAIARRLPN
jgi:hypothetical protein